MTMGEVEEHQAACKHRNIRWVLLFWLAVTKISLIELGFERHIRGSYYPLFIASCFNWSCRCVASSQCHANLTPATLKVIFDDGCEVLSSCCLTSRLQAAMVPRNTCRGVASTPWWYIQGCILPVGKLAWSSLFASKWESVPSWIVLVQEYLCNICSNKLLLTWTLS